MFVDNGALSHDSLLEAEVCIVGAGAAGIAMALELGDRGRDVIVLEGGGLTPSDRSQELYDGEMVTRYRGDLDAGIPRQLRMRCFGGSTFHWSGWCRPLEPLDFEKRDWVPHSGWPIGYAELVPWYRKAMPWIDIDDWPDLEGAPPDPLAFPPRSATVETRVFHFSPPTRFGVKYRERVGSHPSVRVLLETNALRLQANATADRVERVVARVEDGPEISIRARVVILACGGLENPRLLLLSDREQPEGLGNGRDLVGRFFQEHPHTKCGWIIREPGGNFRDHYQRRYRVEGSPMERRLVWVTSPEVRARDRLLGFELSARRRRIRLGRLGASVEHARASLRSWSEPDREDEPLAGGAWELGSHSENAPNPDSRVTLGEERDRLGLRKLRLDWRLGELEQRSIERSFEIIASEFGATLAGRARFMLEAERPFAKTRGGAHHMGTTRMSDDPSQGVVDADCRVHGIDNLYVAGSSVFPTSGSANPTFTLLALALRLADHLQSRLAA